MPPKGITEQEEISEDLLEAIPVEDGASEGLATHGARGDPSREVHEMLARVRSEVEATVQAELERVEMSLSSYLLDMQARLRAADERLGDLAREREELLEKQAENERRWRAIQDLATGKGA